jgi:hypothetical protein
VRIHDSSFRDNHGFVFTSKDTLFRAVKNSYKSQFDHLTQSGLYEELISEKLLIAHEIANNDPNHPDLYKVLRPEMIEFVSYPYEWCFSQLKEAAIITLQIQLKSLKYGMLLKDCSAFNVQFHKGRAIFIDSLSFDFIDEDKPWAGYRQFCEHFLGPLAIIAYNDPRLMHLFGITGIPLIQVNKLLPWRWKILPSFMLHIFIHSGLQKSFQNKKIKTRQRAFSVIRNKRLCDNLLRVVEGINCRKVTYWDNYYSQNVNVQYLNSKKKIVTKLIIQTKPNKVLDVGANDGEFSRIASKLSNFIISIDTDFSSIEKNFRSAKQSEISNLLPLLVDFSKPTPALGWSNTERESFLSRVKVDLVLMLAIVHHLVFQEGIPLGRIASLLALISNRYLIIEFVPKTDEKVQILLNNRTDTFADYNEVDFEIYFGRYFDLCSKTKAEGSDRLIYLWVKRD